VPKGEKEKKQNEKKTNRVLVLPRKHRSQDDDDDDENTLPLLIYVTNQTQYHIGREKDGVREREIGEFCWWWSCCSYCCYRSSKIRRRQKECRWSFKTWTGPGTVFGYKDIEKKNNMTNDERKTWIITTSRWVEIELACINKQDQCTNDL